MKAMPPTAPRLAPATLNSVAPVSQDRCARSRWNCKASPVLIGGGAARRIESLSHRRPSRCLREGRRGKMALCIQAQAMCALADGKRARKER